MIPVSLGSLGRITDRIVQQCLEEIRKASNLPTDNRGLATMANNTLKGNISGGKANPSDLTVAQVQNLLASGKLAVSAGSINLNSVADTAVTIALPSGITNYRVAAVDVWNASTSLTTAKLGVFTAAAAGGLAVAASQALSAITATTANTASNATDLTLASPNPWLTAATLYVRNTVVQGAAATANVTLFIEPLS